MAAAKAKAAGAGSVTVKLENVRKLHDRELIPLIEKEVADMLAKHGFTSPPDDFRALLAGLRQVARRR
jgi:translation elongation factor EF-Tu-like GTPase